MWLRTQNLKATTVHVKVRKRAVIIISVCASCAFCSSSWAEEEEFMVRTEKEAFPAMSEIGVVLVLVLLSLDGNTTSSNTTKGKNECEL